VSSSGDRNTLSLLKKMACEQWLTGHGSGARLRKWQISGSAGLGGGSCVAGSNSSYIATLVERHSCHVLLARV
jgi:hypothetical protein